MTTPTFDMGKLSERDISDLIEDYKKVVLVADGSRSCSDLNIIAMFIENGYEMELETSYGGYGQKIITLTFTQK